MWVKSVCFSQLRCGYIVCTWSGWYHLRLIVRAGKTLMASHTSGISVAQLTRIGRLSKSSEKSKTSRAFFCITAMFKSNQSILTTGVISTSEHLQRTTGSKRLEYFMQHSFVHKWVQIAYNQRPAEVSLLNVVLTWRPLKGYRHFTIIWSSQTPCTSHNWSANGCLSQIKFII